MTQVFNGALFNYNTTTLNSAQFVGPVVCGHIYGSQPKGVVHKNEKLRLIGKNSDYLIGVQANNGRIYHKWNAALQKKDGFDSEPYLVSDEPAWFWDLNINTEPYMNFKYAPSGVAGDAINWQSHMAFTTGGNIGINTVKPKEKLHVNGNAKISQNLDVRGQIVADSGIIKNVNIQDHTYGGTTYTATVNDEVIIIKLDVRLNATAVDSTVVLPDVTKIPRGKTYYIKAVPNSTSLHDSAKLKVVTQTGQTIDNVVADSGTPLTLYQENTLTSGGNGVFTFCVVSDGISGWWIINNTYN